MPESGDFYLKFIADESFIEQVRQEAKENPDALRIEAEVEDEDPSRLGFDLVTVAAIVAIISHSQNILQFSAKILKWLFASKGEKVIIQTPFQTLELSRKDKLTQEDVCKMLEAATKV